MTYYCSFKELPAELQTSKIDQQPMPIQKQNSYVTHCRLVRQRSCEGYMSTNPSVSNGNHQGVQNQQTSLPKIQSKDDWWTNGNNSHGHHVPRSNYRRHVRYHIRLRPLSSVWNFAMLQRELPDSAVAGRGHVMPVIRVQRTRSTPTGACRIIKRQIAFDKPDSPQPTVPTAWMSSSSSSVDDRTTAATTADTTDKSPSPLCNVCMQKPVNCALVNCGHMCMCYDCAVKVYYTSKMCPMCRHPIERVLKTYTS